MNVLPLKNFFQGAHNIRNLIVYIGPRDTVHPVSSVQDQFICAVNSASLWSYREAYQQKNPKATELSENFFTFLTNRHFPLWLHIHKNKRPFVATKRPKKKVVFVGLIWAILQRPLNNSAHSHRIAHKKISQSPKGI